MLNFDLFLALKEWIVAMVVATILFRVVRPVALTFSTPEDFTRRRRLWLLLTTVAFFSPSFLVFSLIAIPALIWGGRKEANPAALFLLLLQVIPPVTVRVPMIGISFLFDLDMQMLLALCVMLPATIRLLRSPGTERLHGLDKMDVFLLGYGLLAAAFFLYPEVNRGVLMTWTSTDVLRRVVVFVLSTFVPYFVISRACQSQRAIQEAAWSFCLAAMLMAAIAVVEALKHWLLYAEMGARWASLAALGVYVLRAGSLRAMASAGHPLALGYSLAMACGLWLGLQHRISSRAWRLGITGLFWLGLIASYSRGPWLGTLCVYLVFAAVGPRAWSNTFRMTAFTVILAALILVSPLGGRIQRVLPFMGGTVDSQNITYREQLFDRASEVIKQSPWLGDPTALLKMQDLRQGQGIIDMLNGYVTIVLGNGFIGLGLFLAFVLVGLSRARAMARGLLAGDPGAFRLGASFAACIVGSLVMFAMGGVRQIIWWSIAALATALVNVAYRQNEAKARARIATAAPVRA
jgi:hypothetical protein